mgnify:CR=1 FL=1
MAAGLNITYTPCHLYEALTAANKPNAEYISDDAHNVEPEKTAQELFNEITNTRESLLKIVFNEVTKAMRAVGINEDIETISTIMAKRAFDACVSDSTLKTEIEKLQNEVAKKLGYKLVDHKLELYGSKIKK